MYTIYKHTNTVTGKSYIGLTKCGMHTRWLGHLSMVRKGSKAHFHCSIRKHGVESWKHEELEINIPSLDIANELERKWISYHNTYDKGYNLTKGGEYTPDSVPKGGWSKKRRETFLKNSATYTFVHHTLGIVTTTAKELADEYNISRAMLTGLTHGDILEAKGWQLFTGSNTFKSNMEETPVTFKNKELNLTLCTTPAKLAKSYGLHSGHLRYVVSGKAKSHKGWTVV